MTVTNNMGSKRLITFDFDAFLKDCVEEATAKLSADFALYRDFFNSGQTQAEFSRSRKIKSHTLDNIRRRYGLPTPDRTVSVHAEVLVKRNSGRRDVLCNNENCKVCDYLARVWHVDRNVN